jgi:hypothetical protein
MFCILFYIWNITGSLTIDKNLAIAQNMMKQQEDQHHSEMEFEVVNQLFLRLQPYKKISLKQQNMKNKLAPKYYGCYKVLHRIGSVS